MVLKTVFEEMVLKSVQLLAGPRRPNNCPGEQFQKSGGASIPNKSMMHIANFPYFQTFLKKTYFSQNLLISFQFSFSLGFFGLNLCFELGKVCVHLLILILILYLYVSLYLYLYFTYMSPYTYTYTLLICLFILVLILYLYVSLYLCLGLTYVICFPL